MTNRGFAALIALGSDHLKDAVGGIALFGRELLIVTQEGFDTALVGAKNRSRVGANQRSREGLIGRKSPANGFPTPSCFFGKLADALVFHGVM